MSPKDKDFYFTHFRDYDNFHISDLGDTNIHFDLFKLVHKNNFKIDTPVI